jgi:FAD/FMN-containing dehydrogenase
VAVLATTSALTAKNGGMDARDAVDAVERAVAELVAALPAGVVVTEQDAVEKYRFDWTHDARAGHPAAVVRAEDADHVVTTMRWASRHGIPVVPRGAGTGLSGGALAVDGGIMLSTERMRAVEIDVDARVAVVEPGALNVEVKRAAAEHGLWYPPDPSSFEICSIGGNIATNAGGLCCVKYGVTTDYVLGLDVVLADGTLATLGGKRVKDVAGLSLLKLFVGSEGTLGVVTKAILRLVPGPQPPATLVATFPTARAAADAVSPWAERSALDGRAHGPARHQRRRGPPAHGSGPGSAGGAPSRRPVRRSRERPHRRRSRPSMADLRGCRRHRGLRDRRPRRGGDVRAGPAASSRAARRRGHVLPRTSACRCRSCRRPLAAGSPRSRGGTPPTSRSWRTPATATPTRTSSIRRGDPAAPSAPGGLRATSWPRPSPSGAPSPASTGWAPKVGSWPPSSGPDVMALTAHDQGRPRPAGHPQPGLVRLNAPRRDGGD